MSSSIEFAGKTFTLISCLLAPLPFLVFASASYQFLFRNGKHEAKGHIQAFRFGVSSETCGDWMASTFGSLPSNTLTSIAKAVRA